MSAPVTSKQAESQPRIICGTDAHLWIEVNSTADMPTRPPDFTAKSWRLDLAATAIDVEASPGWAEFIERLNAGAARERERRKKVLTGGLAGLKVKKSRRERRAER